jgi:hypothetical protein
MRNVFGDPSKVTDLMIDRAYELTLREGNRQAMVARFNQPRRISLAVRIPEIKVPTLIIWGGRDRLVPPDDAERFHQDIAGSTVAVSRLGHARRRPVRTVAAVAVSRAEVRPRAAISNASGPARGIEDCFTAQRLAGFEG